MVSLNKIVTHLKHQIQRDLQDKAFRQREIDAAIKRYIKRWIANNRSPDLYQPLEKLAKELEANGLDSLELFKVAWEKNPDDSNLLLRISRTLLGRGNKSKEALNYYKIAVEHEPNKFIFFEAVADYYRENSMIYELMLTNEQIVDTFERYQEIMESGTDEEKLQLVDVDWSRAGQLYETAKQELLDLYLNLGRKDKRASALYTEVLRADPENIDVLEMLVEGLLKQKRTDPEALEVYEHYLAYKPDARHVIYLLSKGYLEQSRDKEAIALLEGCYRSHPDDHASLEQITNYYLAQTDLPEEALYYLKEYAKLHPQNHSVLRRIVTFYARAQRSDSEAVSYYKRYLPLTNKPDKFLVLIAQHYYREKNWLEAIEILERLYNLGHRDRNTILQLATAYANCGRKDAKAILLYESAIQEGSENILIRELLSDFYYTSNRSSELAYRCFTETLQVNPRHHTARLGLAKIYLNKKDYSATVKECLVVLQTEPTHQEALRLCAKAIALSNEDSRVFDSLSSLPEQSLLQIYRQAFEMNPALKKVTLWLSSYFIKKKICDTEALKVYTAALAFSPNNIELLNMQALSHYEAGEPEKAINIDNKIFSICNQTCVLKPSIPESSRSLCANVCIRLTKSFLEKKFSPPDKTAYSILVCAYQRGFVESDLILHLAELSVKNKFSSDLDVEILERAVSISPHRRDMRKYLVNLYLKSGKPEPIIKHCRFLLESNPDDTEALQWLIDCLSQYPVHDIRLESLLEELYWQNPTRTDLIIALALLYGKMQHFDHTTLKFFEHACQIRPDDLQLQTFLARCYEKLGNFQKAIFMYQRIRWAIPDDIEIIQRLAYSYMKADIKNAQVLNIVNQTLRLSGEDPELNLFKCDLLFYLGKQEEALKSLEEIKRQFPEKVNDLIAILEKYITPALTTPSPAMAKLATLLIDRGDLDAGVKYLEILSTEYKHYMTEILDGYNKILNQDPNHMLAHIERAILYRLVGEFELAAKDLESVIGFAEFSPNILYELAETYEAWIKQEKDPERKLPLMYKLGRLYFRLGEFDQCISVYQNILHLDKLSQEALFYLARCFHRKNTLELALQYCKRLEKSDEVKSLLYDLGDAFYSQHNLKAAAEAFNEIVNADISFRDAALKFTEVQKELQGTLLPQRERESLLGELSDRARTRFDLREEIGHGAWSIVIKAYDRELDEFVALKILPSRFSEDAAAVELFKNEARLARRLSHPKIVRIYDIGEEAGRKYISMEYVKGKSLRDILEERRHIPPLEAISIALQIADALDYAHRKNVLHRDIKPANIIITPDNQVKITDFGIAAVVSQSEKVSTEFFIGTPLYMSPEQVEGKPCNTTSDLYSLGVVMYEMISGTPPFKVGNIAYHHLFTKPPPLKNIPPPLGVIILKCLEKKPENRYQSAKEIINDLKVVRELLESENSSHS
ncbi:protein kinase [Candidatus Sumerlaeota bacterium]|nr:protein kinase [Candidatus Sumerlaeota bacterium]